MVALTFLPQQRSEMAAASFVSSPISAGVTVVPEQA